MDQLHSLVDRYGSTNQPVWVLNTTLIVLSIFLSTYVITSLQSAIAFRSHGSGRKPPVVPYFIPILGNTIPFARDPAGFVASLTSRFGSSVPLHLRVGFKDMFLVAGSDNVSAIFRETRNLAPKQAALVALENVFGSPKHAVAFYDADDSGTAIKPHPDSNMKPEHRIFYLQHKTAHTHLSGANLNVLTSRFMINLRKQIFASSIESEWVDLPDLYSFLQVELFHAAVEAMCGPYVFSLTPSFIEDFWEFDRCMPDLFKGYPRWLFPASYKARDKVLTGVKKWHAFARAHSDSTKHVPDDADWDQYFGSKFITARLDYSKNMGAMNEDAVASEDLGLMWAANANSIPAASWFLLELVRDPCLLSRVRHEVESARITGSDPKDLQFDITKLCNDPLLQSIYAETLRLRVAIMVTRTPERTNFRLGDWTFPRDKLIIISSRTAGLDKDMWSSGSDGDPHPLEEFWADRFLVYPNDSNSGPLKKKDLARNEKLENGMVRPDDKITTGGPKFSMEGLGGAWVPYGGGQRMCPGRHFAKQEMIASFAMLCTAYDIELRTEAGFQPEPDMRYYPFGGLPPKGKIPFRIRRRKV